MGLSPVAFGLVGLLFALWGNGIQLLGGFPQKEGIGPTGPSIGVAASLVGAFTLTADAAWFVVGAPFGHSVAAVQQQLLFVTIALMYGLLWFGAGFAQLRGWDLRPIGQLAVLCFLLQVFQIIVIITQFRPWSFTLTGIVIALALYLPVLTGFYLLTHGRTSARWVGWSCIVATVSTGWLTFAATGIAPFLTA